MYMYSRIVNEIVTTYEPQILEKSKFFRQQVEIFVKSSVRGSLACTSVGIMPMTSLCLGSTISRMGYSIQRTRGVDEL